MRINTLPAWATTALISGPYFGSDNEDGENSGGEAGAGAATLENPPEADPTEKKAEVNEEAARAIRERDNIKAERDALAQEKQEREAREAEAQAATRSKEENQAAQIETLTKDVESLSAVNERNLLKLSIYENRKYDWVDANDVALLIDKSNVKINPKTGEVSGVDDALKDLAKAKPHLLKAAQNNEENSGNGNGAATGGIPSGGTPSGGSGNNSKAAKHKAMKERFGSVLGV